MKYCFSYNVISVTQPYFCLSISCTLVKSSPTFPISKLQMQSIYYLFAFLNRKHDVMIFIFSWTLYVCRVFLKKKSLQILMIVSTSLFTKTQHSSWFLTSCILTTLFLFHSFVCAYTKIHCFVFTFYGQTKMYLSDKYRKKKYGYPML